MAEKIRIIKKEIGKSAEIVELDDVEKEIEAFVKDPCIEYYPHPKKDVNFIVGLNAQSWDNPATVVLGEREEVLGGTKTQSSYCPYICTTIPDLHFPPRLLRISGTVGR